MSNLAAALKAEISRLARKEAKALNKGTADLAKANRNELRSLKQTIREQQRTIARLQSGSTQTSPTTETKARRPEGTPDGFRYSVRSLKSQRRRLKLTAAEYAQLLNVSMQTVYNWEQDKARPRDSQMARIVELRGMGRREALAQLEGQAAPAAKSKPKSKPKSTTAKKAPARKKARASKKATTKKRTHSTKKATGRKTSRSR